MIKTTPVVERRKRKELIFKNKKEFKPNNEEGGIESNKNEKTQAVMEEEKEPVIKLDPSNLFLKTSSEGRVINS